MSVRSLLAELEITDADGVVVAGRNGVRFCFELVIDGLFTGAAGAENALRFYSGPRIPDIASPGVIGTVFAQSIVGIDPYKARFDSFKGWVSAGATKVTLRPSRRYPLNDLMMMVDGVPYRGELATEIAYSAEPPFAVSFRDTHPNHWPAAGTLCVGLEVMTYTVAGGVMTITDRAVFGSPRQRHKVDPSKGTYPVATSHIIAWEGRPARVLLSVERADGSRALDSIELVAGFLDGPPTERDPSQVALAVTPWSAALEKKVGGRDAFTGLQHGWKVWGAADPGRTFRVQQRYPAGAYHEAPDGLHPDGETLLGTDDALHSAIFDIAARPPLNGRVSVGGGSQHTVTYNEGQVRLSPAPFGATWTQVQSIEATLTREAALAPDGEQAVRWPNAAVRAIAEQLQPGSHLAGDAAPQEPGWIDVRLALDDGAGQTSLHCIANGRGQEPVELVLTPHAPGSAWYGIDVADPADAGFTLASERYDRGTVARSAPAVRQVPITAVRGDRRAGRVIVPIRGVADAWWSHEKWIHVESDRPFPAPPFTAVVTWDERGRQRTTYPRIVAVTAAANVFPGVPGYLLEVDRDDRGRRLPFGDWDGKRSVQIRASINARDVGPGRLLLQLLTSRNGDGANGPYDVLPFGAGVPYSRVADNTFLGYPVDALISDVDDIDLTANQALGDLIGGTLRAMRAHLVEHLDYDTGRRVWHLEAADLAMSSEAIAVHIQDGRWYKRRRPGTSTDRRVVNRIDFEANFVDGEPTMRVSVVDDGLVAECNGQEHAVVERLRGVRVQPGATTAEATLRAIADARFAQHGRPRRRFGGSLPATDMLRTSPGAVVLASSSTTRGADGALGISAKPAQIVDWLLNPWRMECQAVLELGPQIVRGYGPNLKVTAIVAPSGPGGSTRVRVAANAFTSPVNRRTGQSLRDVDYWHVAQRVRFMRPGVVPRKWPPRGQWALITDIDRDPTAQRAWDEVEFSVEHGFDPVRLGMVDLPAYPDALPADQQRWCWIGLPPDPDTAPAYTFRYV